MSDRVVLAIGTRKGPFIAESANDRRDFELRGPFGDLRLELQSILREEAGGFPEKESFFTVQRDAMDIDTLPSYLGTTTGQLWAGRDGGEDWSARMSS